MQVDYRRLRFGPVMRGSWCCASGEIVTTGFELGRDPASRVTRNSVDQPGSA